MMVGNVSLDGVPSVLLTMAGQTWPAIIDTGFNGDLELPASLMATVNARFDGRIHSLLAGGQTLVEDTYIVDFPFDGESFVAEATFVSGGQILIGTQLLRNYRLEISFPARTVLLERVV